MGSRARSCGKGWLGAALAALVATMLVASPAALAGAVPFRVDIEATTDEVDAGSDWAFQVVLKDAKGKPVAARADVRVTVKSDLLGETQELTIPAGRESTGLKLAYPRSGNDRVRASAPQLRGSDFMLLVTPRAAIISPGRRHAGACVSTAALLAQDDPAPGGGASGPRLELRISEPRLDNDVWQSVVKVSLVSGSSGQLVPAPQPIVVDLFAMVGTPAAESVTIEKGKYGARTELISRSAGEDTVTASSALGGAVTSAVVYGYPDPARLSLVVSPDHAYYDGRSSMRITVLLHDRRGLPTVATQPIRVDLSANRGDVSPGVVEFKPADSSATASWKSAERGRARLVAYAAQMQNGDAQGSFHLPWWLLALAAVGGAIGSWLRNVQAGSERRPIFTEVVPTGAFFGLLFFALVFFGLVGALGGLDLTKVPTVNELGAGVLGALGGYQGYRILTPTPAPSPGVAARPPQPA